MEQIIANIFIGGANILLIGLGFVLIYSVAKFFHFAHAAIYILGPYLLLFFHNNCKLSFILSILCAALAASIIGTLNYYCVFYPIQRAKGTPLTMLLASIGSYTIIQNIVALNCGSQKIVIGQEAVKEGLMILNARITPIQITRILLAILFTILTWLLLKRSKIGKASRAISNNTILSEICGINVKKIIGINFAYSSCIAAIGGIVMSIDLGMTPNTGFRPLILAVIAMIIGGINSIPGFVLGVIIVSSIQNIATWFMPAQWQDAIVLVIMLIFLIFRPVGIFGKKQDVSTSII